MQHPAICQALLALFGPGQPLAFEEVAAFEGKIVQYTSDIPEAQP